MCWQPGHAAQPDQPYELTSTALDSYQLSQYRQACIASGPPKLRSSTCRLQFPQFPPMSTSTAHISPGAILWLPAPGWCWEEQSRLIVDPDLDDGCFDHPVLVLRKSHQQETALILIVSQDE